MVGVEDELQESFKKINWIQKKLLGQNNNLEEQVRLLWEEVESMITRFGSEPTKTERIDLVSRLCLLSELTGALDFDRMIETRERFRDLFPEHFREYLNYLKTVSWEITWSGCLGCHYFSGRCALNLVPIETPTSDHRLRKFCPSRIKKSSKL